MLETDEGQGTKTRSKRLSRRTPEAKRTGNVKEETEMQMQGGVEREKELREKHVQLRRLSELAKDKPFLLLLLLLF